MYDKLFSETGVVKSRTRLAVYEGVYACHTVLHNHSFRSKDWGLENLKNDLKRINFITMSSDTSDHKHVKQPPILVCYCQTVEALCCKPEGRGFDIQ
jgi:hypothetical protein